MFDQFQATIQANSTLSKLVEVIQKQGIKVKESEDFVSYYSNYKVIALDIAPDEEMIINLLHEFGHYLQTLDSNYSKSWCKYYQEEDAWFRGAAFYKLIFNKDVPNSYYERQQYCLSTYEQYKGTSIFHFQWDYNGIGNEEPERKGILPNSCDIKLFTTKLTEQQSAAKQSVTKPKRFSSTKLTEQQSAAKQSVTKPKRFSSIIVGITACSLLIIGGTITFNSFQKQTPKCNDYDCIF